MRHTSRRVRRQKKRSSSKKQQQKEERGKKFILANVRLWVKLQATFS
jgi:hypothetical protein